MSSSPWICPKCSNVYGPGVSECRRCNAVAPATTPEITPYPWPHGTRCSRCGALIEGVHYCFTAPRPGEVTCWNKLAA